MSIPTPPVFRCFVFVHERASNPRHASLRAGRVARLPVIPASARSSHEATPFHVRKATLALASLAGFLPAVPPFQHLRHTRSPTHGAGCLLADSWVLNLQNIEKQGGWVYFSRVNLIILLFKHYLFDLKVQVPCISVRFNRSFNSNTKGNYPASELTTCQSSAPCAPVAKPKITNHALTVRQLNWLRLRHCVASLAILGLTTRHTRSPHTGLVRGTGSCQFKQGAFNLVINSRAFSRSARSSYWRASSCQFWAMVMRASALKTNYILNPTIQRTPTHETITT